MFTSTLQFYYCKKAEKIKEIRKIEKNFYLFQILIFSKNFPQFFIGFLMANFILTIFFFLFLAGWHILVDVNSLTNEFSFQLTDPIRRNVYQFRTESSEETNLWLHHLNQAVNVNNINKRSSKNLMSFDWTNSNLFLLCPQALK